MSKMISVKDFLGKFFTEMNQGIKSSDKYKFVGLENFFEQKFLIQDNKIQMIVDPSLEGLSIIVNGNEVQISADLYHHPSVIVSNSMEQGSQNGPKKLFSKETFSTMAYLLCQNHTIIRITDNFESPIYITYNTEYESFYNSVFLFLIDPGLDIEIVENVESHCALNFVSNYIIDYNSVLNLTTFYHNQLSAESYSFKNVVVLENSAFEYNLLGKSSAKVLDEIKINYSKNTSVKLNGVIHGNGGSFHSVVVAIADEEGGEIFIDYKSILENKTKVTLNHLIDIRNATTANVKMKNLILDDNSFIMAKPVLDIYSADAVCFHGVSNSTINEDELLYLMSRKISKDDAVKMIKKSFFNDIINDIDINATYDIKRFYDFRKRFILQG